MEVVTVQLTPPRFGFPLGRGGTSGELFSQSFNSLDERQDFTICLEFPIGTP